MVLDLERACKSAINNYHKLQIYITLSNNVGISDPSWDHIINMVEEKQYNKLIINGMPCMWK